MTTQPIYPTLSTPLLQGQTLSEKGSAHSQREQEVNQICQRCLREKNSTDMTYHAFNIECPANNRICWDCSESNHNFCFEQGCESNLLRDRSIVPPASQKHSYQQETVLNIQHQQPSAPPNPQV